MSETSQLGWRMLTYAASAAVLVFLPLLMSPNMDALYLFVIAPCLFLTGICVLIYTTIQKKLPICDGRDILDRLSAAICLQLPNAHFHEMVFMVGPIQRQGSGPARLNQWRIEAHRVGWLGMGWSRLLGFSCFRSRGFALRTGQKPSVG